MRIRAALAGLAVIAASVVMPLAVSDAASAACVSAFPEGQTVADGTQGDAVFFAIPGLCLGPAATFTVTQNPDAMVVSVTGNGSASAGVLVTPPDATPGAHAVAVQFTDGSLTKTYSIGAYFGVSSKFVWPDAVPNQLEIPLGGGQSQFTLIGLRFAAGSACEIKIASSPDDGSFDLFLEPANTHDLPIVIGIKDRAPFFAGIVTVNYEVDCRAPGQPVDGRTWVIRLYVGVPIPPDPAPALAETGAGDPTVLLGTGTAALLLGFAALVTSRRRRVTTGR